MTHAIATPTLPHKTHMASDMIKIPAGKVWIGSDEGSEAERPHHEVFVGEFRIDPAPVTNAMFRVFAETSGYRTEAEKADEAWGYSGDHYRLIRGLSWRTFAAPERDDHPVVLVSWYDAVAYAEWAGKRLPTEIEWEKAAKGGLEPALYPWGAATPEGACNWNRSPNQIPPTTAVKTFAPNAYGVYDLVGNVWQWCSDDFRANYDAPAVSALPSLKARRGGAWNVIQAFRLRCANRGAMAPSTTAPNVGFRCASIR